jgi:hypothetical protein
LVVPESRSHMDVTKDGAQIAGDAAEHGPASSALQRDGRLQRCEGRGRRPRAAWISR